MSGSLFHVEVDVMRRYTLSPPQGPETDPRAVDKIRTAIARGEDTSVCLLNYRADGSTFWNQFFVAGLRDSDGNTVNYVGVQSKGGHFCRVLARVQRCMLLQGTELLLRRNAMCGCGGGHAQLSSSARLSFYYCGNDVPHPVLPSRLLLAAGMFVSLACAVSDDYARLELEFARGKAETGRRR
jgi:hypothetical protein